MTSVRAPRTRPTSSPQPARETRPTTTTDSGAPAAATTPPTGAADAAPPARPAERSTVESAGARASRRRQERAVGADRETPPAGERAAAHRPDARPRPGLSAPPAASGATDSSPTAGPEAAARRVYASGADRTYDLSSRAGRQEMIRNTPQIDNIDSTRNDDMRCGGAAAFNAMVLDGNHAANATAIERTASQSGRTLSADERTALGRFRSGRMTGHDAARLQNVLYDCGRRQDGDPSGTGTRGSEMRDLLTRLRSNGAYPNTAELRFSGSFGEGDGPGHWTVDHRSTSGERSFADSWPQADGHAVAHDGTGGPGTMIQDGMLNPELRYEISMRAQPGDQTRYGVQAVDEHDYTQYIEATATTPNGHRPTADDWTTAWHPVTG